MLQCAWLTVMMCGCIQKIFPVHMLSSGTKNRVKKTLEEAAILAAYFSKSQQSSSVPVDYTLIRHVKKPNGSKPGYVTYDNQKTLFVTPAKDIVDQLRVK